MFNRSTIYVITTVHPSDDVRIYYREIKSLVKKYRVIFLAPDNLPKKEKSIEIINFEAAGRIARGHKYYKYLRDKGAKIIHFHDIDFAPFAIALKYRNRAKIIFDKHEFTSLTIENRAWAPKILKPFIRFGVEIIEKLFSYFCDEIIVANPKQLKKDKRATLLLNVPPKENFRNFNNQKDYKRICYIGDVTTTRGGNNLIEIAELLPESYYLYIVGKIRERDLEKRLSKVGAKIIGYLPNSEIEENMRGVGVGLIPFQDRKQYHESVPSKIFDYLAMGMVVIAADFTKNSFGDNISFGEGVLFVSSKPKIIAQKIVDLNKKNNLAKYSNENYSYFQKKYNWGNEEKKLLKLYQNLMEELN